MAKQIFEVDEGLEMERLLLEVLSKFPNIKYERAVLGVGGFGGRHRYILRSSKKMLNQFFMSWVGHVVQSMSVEEREDVFRFLFKLRNQSR